MQSTVEAVIKAPTAFEQAKHEYDYAHVDRSAPGHEATAALARMVTALAQEIADEREIVRGQAAVIMDLCNEVRSIAQRIADAGEAALPQATLDAAHDPASTCEHFYKETHDDIRLGGEYVFCVECHAPLYPRGGKPAPMPSTSSADAADFWTIRPDEPAEFAGHYPAARP